MCQYLCTLYILSFRVEVDYITWYYRALDPLVSETLGTNVCDATSSCMKRGAGKSLMAIPSFIYTCMYIISLLTHS